MSDFYKVYNDQNYSEAGREELDKLFSQSKSKNESVTVISLTEDNAKELSKRHHDVKAALRTIGFAFDAIKSGYKYDDDKAEAKITAVSKAIAVLEMDATRFFDEINSQ